MIDRATRPRIYVGGPHRATSRWGLVQNVRRAEDLGLLVFTMGGIPVITHRMYENYSDLPEEYWAEACRSLLSTCHAMAVNVSRERSLESSGTTDEIEVSRQDLKPIFYDEPPVPHEYLGHDFLTVAGDLQKWIARWREVHMLTRDDLPREQAQHWDAGTSTRGSGHE